MIINYNDLLMKLKSHCKDFIYLNIHQGINELIDDLQKNPDTLYIHCPSLS
jgi:hypothetical protein